jgi:hypothetical protein
VIYGTLSDMNELIRTGTSPSTEQHQEVRMKGILVCAGAAAALVACADARQPTEPVAAPSFAATAAAADNGAANTSTPIRGVLFSPCSGESIIFHGRMHVVTHTRTDASGGTHMIRHTNFEDVSGVAIGSGRPYRLVQVTNNSANATSGGATEFTQVVVFRVISQGSTDNWLAQIVVHVTVNANGDMTADVTQVGGGCRG